MGDLCGMLASLERHVSYSAVRQCHILLQCPLNITKYILSLHCVPKAALLCAGSGGDTLYMERRFFWGMLREERKRKKNFTYVWDITKVLFLVAVYFVWIKGGVFAYTLVGL